MATVRASTQPYFGNLTALRVRLQNVCCHYSTAPIKRGAGGRSSVSGLTVTVFGATGFLGRYVVNRLGRVGSQVVVPHRGDEYYCGHLKVMGDLGQINFQLYSPRDPKTILNAMKYSNAVINLIGRDYETRNYDFHETHVEIPRLIAETASSLGITNLIHVSAINANHNSPSAFLRSKIEGEEAVHDACPSAVIMRPADMAGEEDKFLNYYSYLARMRFVPVLKEAFEIYKSPVYVVDVARAIINTLTDPQSAGRTYELTGSDRLLLADLVNYIQQVTYRPQHIAIVPKRIYNLIAYILELNPFFPRLTRDKLIRQYISDSDSEDIPGLEDLGIKPVPLEAYTIQVVRRHRLPDHYKKPLDDVEPLRKSS